MLSVGAGLLAKIVNDNACIQAKRVAGAFFASKLGSYMDAFHRHNI